MIIPYNFGISVKEYTEQGTKNDFPVFDRCPCCKGLIHLVRHGFYWRNALSDEEYYRLPICRLKCPSCGKTISLLPSFLLPYFQHTVKSISQKLKSVLTGQGFSVCRQLSAFYRKRYLRNLNWIEMFFRDTGFRDTLPVGTKEKAIRLLEMVRALTGEGRHLHYNFMAH